MNSTHQSEVIDIVLERHENADALSIVKRDGYTLVVQTEAWKDRKKAIHILPESLVDTNRPEFAFLADSKGTNIKKVKPKKLRGVVSYGFLVPAPDDAVVGEDWSERLGVGHYEPEEALEQQKGAVREPAHFSKYDIDTLLKYHKNFVEGERVFVDEKINGQNARYIFKDGQMFCGSRSYWKVEDPNCVWWKCLKATPALEKLLRDNPGTLVYGEVPGDSKWNYGRKPGEVGLFVFDIYKDNRWLDHEEAREFGKDLPWAPLIADCGYNLDKMKELAEGNSVVAGATHIREGIVLVPEKERVDYRGNRLKMKVVSVAYQGK